MPGYPRKPRVATIFTTGRATMNASSRIEVQLIPLEHFAEPVFDLSQLPFAITPDVQVEDVSAMMPPSDFAFMATEVGKNKMRFFDSTVKFGLVHRYVL